MTETAEVLTVDGVSLSTLAYNIELRSDRWTTAGKRGQNVVVPGMRGALWVPGKAVEELEWGLGMWVVGSDPATGLVAADRRTQVQQNLDKLTRLFGKAYGLLDIRQVKSDGSTRQTLAEVTTAIDFTSMAGATRAEFAVALRSPDGCWKDIADQTQTVISGTGTTVDVSSQFGQATLPMDDLVYVVTGPINNPRLTDALSGAWIQYTGSLAGGETWTVDSSLWTSKKGATDVIAATTKGGGGPRFLVLTPDVVTGNCVLSLTGSGQSAATQVQVTGRRRYALA